jgi:UDP-3-O-[3-hydroxymyristoyl] glucosamine N-acyltransferase
MQKSNNFEKGFNIERYVTFDGNIKVHPDATIGKGSKVGNNTVINKSILGTVEIGDDCVIGNYSLVEDDVVIGDGTKVWHYTHIRSDVRIGEKCILGNYVYIDSGVTIGNETKIQNYVPVYHGVELEEGVFLGPNSLTTNDMFPRARTEEGEVQTEQDWQVSATHISKDVSIGAGAVIRPGVTIGEKALIGAGAVVIKNVPPGAVVVGNPGKIIRYIEGYGPK